MNLDIPASWPKIDLAGQSGTIMVIGASDAGKTTLAHYLFHRLNVTGQKVAFLDGDPGQTQLGPPTTLTITMNPVQAGSLSVNDSWRWFVGSTSPSGHMLSLLVGVSRLIHAAAAPMTVYDCSGFIEPSAGGAALKFAEIDLLQPSLIVAIQKNEELEPILQPLRRSSRSGLIVLGPSPAVIRRDSANRQQHRAEQFALYFKGSRIQAVNWTRYGVFPYPQFALNRLVALEDRAGFTLALGIIRSIDRQNRTVNIFTPLNTLEKVVSIHMGDLLVEPGTFRDQRI